MKQETVVSCLKLNNKEKPIMVIDNSYQQLDASHAGEPSGEIGDQEEIPGSGVLIHIPEGGKVRWNHIEDLDSFFTKMYNYHQKGGFVCMMLREFSELFRFTFVVCFVTYLFHGIDYSILFRDDPKTIGQKVSILDAFLPIRECFSRMGLVTWICLFIAFAFWAFRLTKFLYNFSQFWDIKSFYNTALKINDYELDNLTWHDIQKKVREVQQEQEMCVHKKELTELDIYHRILRFKNYMVAMINKSLIPVQLRLPFVGDIIFMTHGLKYNLEFLLFWGPWSPFENNWHLRDDFKKVYKRQELARNLSKHIMWMGIANFLLSPLIFLWQILYFSFSYGEVIKREPGILSLRIWSLYGRLYLRHFNELDHELTARLNRAYRPACKYMNMFTSPLVAIIAENVAFVFGSIFVVVFILSCYDEDIITVQHFVIILTVSGTITSLCRALIPDENIVWCPESLLTAILAHIHYRPDAWRGQAHTKTTRAQVSQLFQYRAVHLLEELISPLITPYILCFHLRYRALDIVDFYRNFTVEVTGVGDVCSFSQMDVRRHGNPLWQTVLDNSKVDQYETDVTDKFSGSNQEKEIPPISNQYTQAEDGKTELSLIHFTITNPEWKPPKYAENFVSALREKAKKEVTTGYLDNNPLFCSINSLCSLGPEYNNVISNILRNNINPTNLGNASNVFAYSRQGRSGPAEASISREPGSSININKQIIPKAVRCGARKAEGPIDPNEKGVLQSLQEISGEASQSFGISTSDLYTKNINTDTQCLSEVTTVDMSLSTLYLHELHHRQLQRQGYRERATKNIWRQGSFQELETLSEMRQEQAPLLVHQDSSLRTNRKF